MKAFHFKINVFTILLAGISFTLATTLGSARGQEIELIKQLNPNAITFIMGEDVDTKNPYYRKAELYYRIDEENKTEIVVTGCHSLVEVQQYLINNAPGDQQPWELINLVSHGNHYLGLGVKTEPDGKRASADRIEESIEKGILKKIPENVINDETIIELHGCGLGNNKELVEAVKSAFSNKETSPKIVASKYFEYFVSDGYNEQHITKYFADFWIISYKMGYKPSNQSIEKKFAAKYPKSDVNWKEALSNEQAIQAGEVFHYTFDVPVKWIFRYDCKDSIPELENDKMRLQWATKNPRIIGDLQKLNLSPENFNWWMRTIYVKNKDGSKTPALWVKGYCTMLCVLKLLPPNNGIN